MSEIFNREKLIQRLHALPFNMFLTALTSEYCIEVNVVSSKGTSYTWEGLDDFNFPAYCLNGLSKDEVILIKDHILNKTLYLNDLNRTQIKDIIFTEDETKELSSFFANFLELPDEKIESLYCYVNSETRMIFVSSTVERISQILNEQYPVDTNWEDLTDKQLAEYLNEYEGSEIEIPFSYFE